MLVRGAKPMEKRLRRGLFCSPLSPSATPESVGNSRWTAGTARRSRTAERSESVSEEAEDLRCLIGLVSRRTLSLPPDYTVSCNTFLPVYTFVCTDKQRQSTGRICKVGLLYRLPYSLTAQRNIDGQVPRSTTTY
jgi:hypothetical protein